MFHSPIIVCHRGGKTVHQPALPILENKPPRQFKLYTWAQYIDPAAIPGTPQFLSQLRDLVGEARDRYRHDTGKPPRKLTLRSPLDTLGPHWHLRVTGTYGALDSLVVLRDPTLGPAEFALSR